MEFEENISLKEYSNLRVGGPARYFKIAKSRSELIEALGVAREKDLKIFVLGGGTNILWSDKGYGGLVLKPELNYIEQKAEKVVAGSTVTMADLVEFSLKNGLAGLDWAGGLPGTVGGAVFGNAGCFGGEMKDSILNIESLDMNTLKFIKRNREDCRFGYRDSIFKSGGVKELIVEVTLSLGYGDEGELRKKINSQKEYRKEHQPLGDPNLGSFFKNVKVNGLPDDLVRPHKTSVKTDPLPVIPAAHLISASGLKGVKAGGAMVSEKHPNFLVNTGSATTADFLSLIERIKETVREKQGISLEEEVKVIE